MNEQCRLSGLHLAKLIKEKKTTPSEVVESHIAHLLEVNPQINAMCENNFEEARRLAAEQTALLAETTDTSTLPVYFGVPFTVKEMFSMSGFRRTGGSIHRKDDVQSYDATVVTRMKQAGAIPLCTTNVPELGFWFESYNVIYGRTNNPYDITRTSGGSSGGEGAMVGSGASPLGLGSDIGGSIRMPAGFCGVFGHKPTQRAIPLTGHFPFSREDFSKKLIGWKYPYTSMGPLCRKAEDLRPMMEILSGPDEFDQETLKNFKLKAPIKDVTKLKFIILEDPIIHGARRTDDEQKQVVKNVGKLFQELGAEVFPFSKEKFFKHSVQLWLTALSATKEDNYYELLRGNDEGFSVGKEIFKMIFGKANYTFPSLVVSAGEVLGFNKKDKSDLLAELRVMRQQFHEMFDDHTVLIMPLHPRVAPKHKAPFFSPFDFIFTGIINVLGNPATVVPMGLNDQNIPLAIQVIAGMNNDHLCLSVAEYLESTFGGWVPPEN